MTAIDEDASPAFAAAFFVRVDVEHLLFVRALGQFVLLRTRSAFLRFRFCGGKTKRSTAVDQLRWKDGKTDGHISYDNTFDVRIASLTATHTPHTVKIVGKLVNSQSVS